MKRKIMLAWCRTLRRIISCVCYITLKLKQQGENKLRKRKYVDDIDCGLF
jgi:hypothetical protein